jgi:hypothetical protein
MKTISLELARELKSVCKEKNVTMPESYHSWYEYRKGVYCLRNTDNGKTVYKYLAPTYTLDELLEILPKSIKNKYRLCLTTNNYKEYMIYYEKHTNAIRYGTNPANAACKLLIWLIKEELYENKRK